MPEQSSRPAEQLIVKSTSVVKARYGSAFRVARGEYLKAINFNGAQAADVWAFSADEPSEFSAVDHTRSFNSSIVIDVGLALMSSKRRPMLTLVEDTSQGRHDTLLCPCSAELYRQLGCTTYHRSCTDNLHEALADADVIMTLRLQKERQEGGLLPSLREYTRFFGISAERVKLAASHCLVMHPGPMNEGVEIMPDVATSVQSVIEQQVTNGVAVRMALLYRLAGE